MLHLMGAVCLFGCSGEIQPAERLEPDSSATDVGVATGATQADMKVRTKTSVARPAVPVTKDVTIADLPPMDTPAMVKRSDFVGSKACRSCHEDQFRPWAKSTHGNAGGPPSEKTVIPAFDGRVLRFKDAQVTLKKDGRRYSFLVEENGRKPVRIVVTSVIGSGRIFGGATQTYFTELPDGRTVMLPFDYSITNKTWFCQAESKWRVIDKHLSLRECQYPAQTSLGHGAGTNCQDCHGSQISLSYNNQNKKFETEFTELAVNCESCHGPGARHVKLMKEGSRSEDIGLEPLDLLSAEESVGVCGRCHMDKSMLAGGYLMGAPHEDYFSSVFIRDPRDIPLDIDGAVLRFSYQESHLYSSCFREGSMTCVDCHDPHSGQYRDIWGTPINDRFGDAQCTDCHPSKLGSNHTAHPNTKIKCVECHMPMRQHPSVGDMIQYRRSDHAISIPRLRGLGADLSSHGCGHCHSDKSKSWLVAQQKALYGDGKPEPKGATELNASEVKSAAQNELLGIRQSGALKYAIQALGKVESNHPPLVVRALASYIVASLSSDTAALSNELRLKLTAWLYHENLDVKGAAIATALYLSAYDRGLSSAGLAALKAVQADKQRAVRRRVVFNLLAIMYMVVPRQSGAGQLARRAVEDFAVPLSDSVNPVAALLGSGHRTANQPDQAVDWYRKALADPSFKADRYVLNQAGPKAKILLSLGQVFNDEGYGELARRAFQDGVDDSPRDRPLREALCLHFLKGGARTEALSCITELIKIAPDFVQGYFIKARLYEQMGQLDAALEIARRGLEHDSGNVVARRNVERLERMVSGGR
ncbi:MAG: cytochrome c3 family protein [Myxococcota bacterium]|nr:cytochrome c3 family protein [Myxococcota bacterium]